MPPSGWEQVRRLLVVRLLPGAHLTLLASPAGSQVAPFATVIAALPVRTGLPVALVGGPLDAAVLDAALRGLDGVHWLVGRTSIPHLAAILRRASLAVVNNSGPMHIADAFCRPLVVLYSGSEYEEQWRPRRSSARLLTRPTSCSPCFRFTCPSDMECLDIAPDEVLDACVDMLASVSSAVPIHSSVRAEPVEARTAHARECAVRPSAFREPHGRPELHRSATSPGRTEHPEPPAARAGLHISINWRPGAAGGAEEARE